MRRLAAIIPGAAIVIGGVAAPAPGRAQSAPVEAPDARVKHAKAPAGRAASDDADTVRARSFYIEGVAAESRGRWPDAYSAYLKAWTLKRHSQIAGSLGRAELEIGRYRDAADHLALFLREATGISPEELKRVRSWLDQARAKVGVLYITAEEPGTEIIVDGAPVGREPIGHVVHVDPGRHAVEGRFAACTATSDVEIGAGQAKDVTLSCAPAPMDPSPPSPMPRSDASKWALPVLLGATAGAALAGAVFTILSYSNKAAADTSMEGLENRGGAHACKAGASVSGCEALHSARETQYLYGNLAVGTFIGAGLAGAATTIVAIAAPGGATRTGMQAAPMFAAGGGGLTVTLFW